MNYLKNTLVLILLLNFTLLSCSSDDDNNSDPQAIDKIELALTTSKSAYQNASTGNWIAITETEYNILALALNDVVKSGSTDEEYNFDTTITPVSASANGITMANNNGASMPNDSYVFAFKYHVTQDDIDSAKVKVSSINPQGEYSNLGNILPSHNSGDNYFVLKGNNSPTTNSGFLAVFCPKKPGFKEIGTNTIYYFSQDDSSTLGTTGGTGSALILYQGLSTTEKQWD